MRSRRRLIKRVSLGMAAVAACLSIGAVSGQGASTICPAIGDDHNPGCGIVITINSDGTATVTATGQGPYDGSDDTLVGIVNNSAAAISSVSLSSSTDIFGFDGDGLCDYSGAPAGCDTSDSAPTYSYAPPGVTFTFSTVKSGSVNFTPSPVAANGGTAYFSLEEAIGQGDVNVSAPLVSTAPSISGSTTVGGGGLSVSSGVWSNSPTITYDWYRCTSPTSCSDFGDTGTTYTPTGTDAGDTFYVAVTGTNSSGSETVDTAQTAAVESPPTAGSPSISGSTVVGGGGLSVDPGTWGGSPAPTITYDWYRCTSPTSCSDFGDTGTTYTPTGADDGDTFYVAVTGTNGAGHVTVDTAQTAAIESPPTAGSPSISGSTVVGGGGLSVDPGTWGGSPAPTITYDWYRCTSPTSCSDFGDTGTTYTPTGADDGDTFYVAVTGTNGAGHVTVDTAQTAAVESPPTAGSPSISGSTVVGGGGLSVDPGTWGGSPAPTITYDWYRCTSPTSCSDFGDTGTTYTPTGADDGDTFYVAVTGTNGAGHVTVDTAQTAAIESPPTAGSPSISGSTVVGGGGLSVDPGTWGGSPAPTITYDWYRCTSPTSCSDFGDTGTTYTPTGADDGDTFYVAVTGTNGAGHVTVDTAKTAAVESAPANTGATTLSGSTVVGSGSLTATSGSWSGYPTPTISWEWFRCDSSNNCSQITSGVSASGSTPGSTSAYTPTTADLGDTIYVVVTASNSHGSPTANTNTVGPIGGAPNNTQAPSISGSVIENSTAINVSSGTWTGYPTPTITYAWYRCTSSTSCAQINGAGSNSYVPDLPDLGDTLEVQVTGSNSHGTQTVTTAQFGPMEGAPNNTGPPQIGTPLAAGTAVGVSNGTWTGYPTPTFGYQWQLCDGSGNNCANITSAGANGQYYTPAPADAGHDLQVQVTATNSVGAQTVATAPAGPVSGAPDNTAPPTVSGVAEVGKPPLTVSTGTWSGYPTPTITYQWYTCTSASSCSPAGGAGADTNSYSPQGPDIGNTLEVKVTGKNTYGTQTVTTAAVGPVNGQPQNMGLPQINGTVIQQGQKLQASNGVWTSTSPISYSYEWEQCDPSGQSCHDMIPAVTLDTYTPGSNDIGQTLRVIVTATNAAGPTSATSDQTTAVLIAPPSNSAPPQISAPSSTSGAPQQGQVVDASQGSWQNSPTTYTYQWELCDPSGQNCNNILNATDAGYTPQPTDVGDTLRVIVTASNDGGKTTVTSGPTAIIEGLEASVPPPVLSQSTDLAPVQGSVLIKLPGTNTFVPLNGPIQVPDGSTIDATGGTVSLTTQLPNGTYQTGKFYKGAFVVHQKHKGTVEATLSGGNFKKVCGKHSPRDASAASAHKKPKGGTVRQLWGNAHGDYTTNGRYGSASVSGTIWITEDLCGGTYFKAIKDNVIVIAFYNPHKKHNIQQGQSILIPPPPQH